MGKIAVLGAGYVVKPMIDYFIDICKYEVISCNAHRFKSRER